MWKPWVNAAERNSAPVQAHLGIPIGAAAPNLAQAKCMRVFCVQAQGPQVVLLALLSPAAWAHPLHAHGQGWTFGHSGHGDGDKSQQEYQDCAHQR